MDNTSKQVEIDQFREKLLKLVNEAIDKRVPTLTFGERIADHLIANGVRSKENVQDVHDINVGNKLSGISGQLKWIPVTERLPEEDGKFLVHRIIFGGVSIMSVVGFARNGKKVHEYDLRKKKNVWYEYDSGVGYYALDTVTHWMPLPEPPKEDN